MVSETLISCVITKSTTTFKGGYSRNSQICEMQKIQNKHALKKIIT